MAREEHITVYYDDQLKGHAFYYRKPNSFKAVISDGVYDKVKDCEDSAYFVYLPNQKILKAQVSNALITARLYPFINKN